MAFRSLGLQASLSETDFFCGLGYWTRANVEQCLLATRGEPPRMAKDVRRALSSLRAGSTAASPMKPMTAARRGLGRRLDSRRFIAMTPPPSTSRLHATTDNMGLSLGLLCKKSGS